MYLTFGIFVMEPIPLIPRHSYSISLPRPSPVLVRELAPSRRRPVHLALSRGVVDIIGCVSFIPHPCVLHSTASSNRSVCWAVCLHSSGIVMLAQEATSKYQHETNLLEGM